MFKMVFGIGSGRCGTHSLQKLLNIQNETKITHELGDKPIMTWGVNIFEYRLQIEKIKKRKESIKGDVGFYWLPYVELLISKEDAKIVVLKRDKSETVSSFYKKTISRNHWQEHDGKKYRYCRWDHCFPNMLANTKKEAIEMYWEYYYEEVSKLLKKYPQNLKLWNT